MYLWIACIGGIAGFGLLAAIGANDVANAMGTAVGSRAISIHGAIFLAAVFEFLGATLMGGNVSSTLATGVVDPSMMGSDYIFCLGMLSTLISSTIWLGLSTYFGMPMSSTHSVLGSIIGFGTVKVGLSALNLDTLKRTVASWFLSPCLGGLVSYSIYWALKRWVLMSHDVVDRARLSAHLLFALTIAVDVVFVLVAGPASMRQSSSTVFILFILSYVVSLAFSIYAMKPFLGVMSATKALLYRLLPADLRAKVRSFFDSKQPSDNINLIHPSRVNSGDIEMSTDVSSDVSSQSGGDSLPVETIIDLDDKEIQNNFRPAMIMAACAVALAHGANDVANALGPYFTIYSLYKDGHVGTEKAASMPLGLSIAGGIGIVIGLALWSAPVMRTIGESLTKLTFAKGFCAQFGGSVTVLLATYLGLPISTSAVLVGCVTGVGMVDGWGNIDLKLFLSIVGGWFVTLPITAVFSATIFVILYWMAV